MVADPDSASPLRNARAALLAVGFAVFVAADDLTVVTTMLRPMLNDVGLVLPDGLDDAAWVVNAYLIAFVGVMPLAGRASDVIGRRNLFFVAYAVFLVGTVIIPMSATLTPLLIGRVLTALGGGAMVPVALAVVGDSFSGTARTRALGQLGAIETFGWVWGPLYGALLVRYVGWQWQFWLNIPLAIVGIALVMRYVPNHTTPPDVGSEPAGGGAATASPGDRPKTSWLGPVLLAATLVSLSLALLGDAEIQSVQGLDELRGGSRSFPTTLMWLITAAVAFAFVIHERRSDDPVIDRGWLRHRGVLAALLVNFVVGAALVLAMVDIPIVVNTLVLDVKRAAVLSGWVLAALTSSMALGSWAGGRLGAAHRPNRRWAASSAVLLIGESLTAVALFALGMTVAPTMSWWLVAAELALLGFGLGLVFAPSTDAIVESVAARRRGSAAAMVMVVRLVGLSVGLAALTAWALARFNEGRNEIELPAITDPNFRDAVLDATSRLTTDAVSATFIAAGVATVIGIVITGALLWQGDQTVVDPQRH